MQRLLIASLSTLVLATAAPSYGNEIAINSSNTNTNLIEITPFNLVQRGYQGSFKTEIPSNSAFLAAVNSGKIKARDLVEVAIRQSLALRDRIGKTFSR